MLGPSGKRQVASGSHSGTSIDARQQMINAQFKSSFYSRFTVKGQERQQAKGIAFGPTKAVQSRTGRIKRCCMQSFLRGKYVLLLPQFDEKLNWKTICNSD